MARCSLEPSWHHMSQAWWRWPFRCLDVVNNGISGCEDYGVPREAPVTMASFPDSGRLILTSAMILNYP